MKKSLVVTLALVFVLGIAGTAFANPYSDVPAGHWAYKAVNDLSKAGIVEGYQGKYRGNDNMTRYEMAAITARAMAKADKADADTKATIDKLAVEFSKELNDLGVRVAALEKKAGNVSFSGNARLRYETFDNKNAAGADVAKDDTQKLRIRLDVNGQINEDWRVFGRLEATENFLTSANDTDGKVKFDQLFIQGKLGQTQLTAGRQNYVPVYGMVYDTYFEGAKVAFNVGAVKTNVFYGRDFDERALSTNEPTVLGAEVGFDLAKNLEMKAAYYQFEDDVVADDFKIAEVGLGYKIGSNWKLIGSYSESNASAEDSAMAFNLKYKGANTKTVGTWGAWAQYADMETAATWKTTYASADDFKGYEVGFEYVPFKNSKWTTLYWDGEPGTNAQQAEKVGFRTQLEMFF
ncbi:MAG: S-layer homology domain-containing protein [Sporomusaceae bacterium]|nr:S-layer homology domain-containing protein [Sporomusaceae bacterium]